MDRQYRKFLQMELRRIPQPTADEKQERKKFATLCGHVSRRLNNNERLTGNILELAVRAAPDEKTAEKLKNGEPLDDYEKHLIIDVALLHMRLA